MGQIKSNCYNYVIHIWLESWCSKHQFPCSQESLPLAGSLVHTNMEALQTARVLICGLLCFVVSSSKNMLF